MDSLFDRFKAKSLVSLGLLLVVPAGAAASEIYGYVSVESRVFEQSPAFAEQDDAMGFTFIAEPTFFHEWDDGNRSIEITPYFREDSLDAERDLFDMREMSFLWIQGNIETRIGLSKVFWGVAESQHLVDTINQTDLAASPDGEEKLGQPMVQVVYVSDYGDFSLFVLPGFRERTFPGREGRLRSTLWVDTDNPTYESSAEDERVDVAVRWSRVIGNFDIGLHYFHGTNREPLFVVGTDANAQNVLHPYYELMDQVGLDLQYTSGGWLWKLEAINRQRHGEDFAATVGGFEYTLYGIGGSSVDLGIIAEGHFDARGEDAPTPFDKDLFIGGRFAWNDDADTSLIAGGFVDGNNGSRFARIEFARRFYGSYILEIELQKLIEIDETDPLYSIRRDSYLQIALSRYF